MTILTHTFLSYLTDEQVARQLCKEAGKYAFRHTLLPIGEQLMDLMPPRQYWGRVEAYTEHHAQQRIWKRVTHMTLRHVKHHEAYDYVQRIVAFAAELRKIADDNSFHLGRPTVKALIKDANARPIICRPICTYHQLHEKVLIAMMANYLRDQLDHTFHYHNMAYRAPREWMGQRKVTNNKDAIRLILQWREQHADQPIWVAECDISKFFDTLDHQVVKQVMRRSMHRIGMQDEALLHLFDSFVDAYDFAHDIFAKNDDTDFWDSIFGAERETDFCFQWIDNPPTQAVGLPQGAALSPLIANMVLNEIDEHVLADKMQNGRITDPELLYIRYCDDIVLMHTDLKQCTNLIQRYQQVLEQYALRYHPFKQVAQMKDGKTLLADGNTYPYWTKAKSKAPYLWGDGIGDAVRWIGFLGYEISRTGQVRIRKSSVAAQAIRLCERATRVRYAKGDKQYLMLEKFCQKNVGGSTLEDIVDSPEQMPQYMHQRKRLEQLKERLLRRIKHEK